KTVLFFYAILPAKEAKLFQPAGGRLNKTALFLLVRPASIKRSVLLCSVPVLNLLSVPGV
ncbi:MAG: hypothetical protein ACLFN1_10090, partial [Bacteroidales bacterium]